MTSSKPPSLATWLLKRLVFGGNHEALAGDLLEEFSRRRSRAWYWRQVLIGIAVGVSEELRKHWFPTGVAILLASAGVRMSSTKFLNGRPPEWSADPARLLTFIPQIRSLWAVQAHLDWPESLVYQIAFLVALDVVSLTLAFGSFLILMRRFSCGLFVRGLFMAVPVIVVGKTSSILLAAVYVPRVLGYIALWLPMLSGLALSIYSASSGRSREQLAR